MIFFIFFIFNLELKAPTTEFINRNEKRITIFPLGIEIYEEAIRVLANYGEFEPQEKVFLLKDSVKIFLNKDTCYTDLAVYNLKTKKWEIPQKMFLIANLKDKGRITIVSEKSQYDLEREILSLEKGEIRLKEKVNLFGKKIEIDNRNNFLYSYLETKVMNYDDEEKINNFLSCETLFYDFKSDTGLAKSKVNYFDSIGKVNGSLASFILEGETVKEVIFRNRVFLSFEKEDNKIELECEKAYFLFDKNELKLTKGENIFVGKVYLKKR